ncbi:hypothetical protein MMC30_006617 [Trapelia coarctata]|nr:hypothetical protein [Trapelia coarctata]
MAFILAPYNNAMRLGQGFNTYTQQICIDDAVVIDPDRAENVLANDGSTMRILVQSMGKPSAWSRQKEVVVDDRDKKIEELESIAAGTGRAKPKQIEDAPKKSTGQGSAKQIESASENAAAKEAQSSKSDAQDVEQPEEEQDGEEEAEEVGDEGAANAATPPETEAKEDQEATSATPEVAEVSTKKDGKTKEISQQPGKSLAKVEKTVKAKDTGAKKDDSSITSAAKKREVPAAEEAVGAPRKRAASTGAKPTPADKTGKATTKTSPLAAKEPKAAGQEPQDVDWSLYTSQGAPPAEDKEKQALMAAEKEREQEEKALRREREKERREAEKERKEEEKRRREETKKLVEWGASTVGYTKEELAAMKHNIKFEERFTGMLENKKDFEFEPAISGGPSQIVTYTSRFVDKLSDITDDMNISGSLSIKAGKFGGSGRGAFIDSDKFKSSDLNFYISVKVVNQTINFKDALQFNPIRSVNSDNFREVFGDGFISGFQEGGEFNALVSMKILNKAKKTDIQAEAKVAFTAGPVDIKAEANVNVAKANIETNTETTIQVSWSGGGHIKPREQQWDIQSLMQAAARFPDLVAECPQRIYAIVTKYDTLRSFVKNKPAAYTKLQYENAQIYTNAMMDAYMSYKSLYTRVGSWIFDVQNKTKVIKAWLDDQNVPKETDTDAPKDTTKDTPKDALKNGSGDITLFPASIKGLEDAKKAMRRQMALIVNEVDWIEKDPKLATDDDHTEPYQSAAAFQERIPLVELPEPPKVTIPLGGKRIMAKTQTQEEHDDELKEEAAVTEAPLISGSDGLPLDEQGVLDTFQKQRPGLGTNLRVTVPVGSQTKGDSFNNLEFLQPEWIITRISIEIADGQIAAFSVYYDNGLILSRGKARNGRPKELANFSAGERIIAASIQTGKREGQTEPCVIALQLHTNRGRSLIGQAAKCLNLGEKKHSRDDVVYTDVATQFFDMPLKDGNVKGFWGRSDDTGIWRLGLIWGDLTKAQGDTFSVSSTTADEVSDPITLAATETAKANEKCEEVKAVYAKLKEDHGLTLKTLGERNSQLQVANEQANSFKRAKEEAERSALAWGGRSSAYKTDRVQIHFICYGGEFIWDDSVARRLIQFAVEQRDFSWNDDIFGRDPRPGIQKSGGVIYRYDNTGEVRCLVRKQHEWAKFDPLP